MEGTPCHIWTADPYDIIYPGGMNICAIMNEPYNRLIGS